MVHYSDDWTKAGMRMEECKKLLHPCAMLVPLLSQLTLDTHRIFSAHSPHAFSRPRLEYDERRDMNFIATSSPIKRYIFLRVFDYGVVLMNAYPPSWRNDEMLGLGSDHHMYKVGAVPYV